MSTTVPESESWLRRHVGRHPNIWLLASLLVLLVLYPPLHERHGSTFAFNFVRSCMLLVGLRVAFVDHPLRIFAIGLAILAIVGLWSNFVLPGRSASTVALEVHLSSAAFLSFTVVAVLRSVFRLPEVTPDTLSGALCGYLLVGLTFGHIFTIMHTLAPETFQGVPPMTDVRQQFVLTYFSFITLTTVGYGDILPASDTARSLCLLEAVIGQFYMAVLIAGLIGKWISQTAQPSK
ncbi:MAG: potassium channel family protein [Gemmataceae bacterium]|nr:potassium channel family protein [Gemmataceae bacterium]